MAMQTANFQQLSEDAASVIAVAQDHDVLIVNEGKVVAVVSKPRPQHDKEFWAQREKRLAEIVLNGEWDSTKAISEDRDRL
jgi:hypothetical protein